MKKRIVLICIFLVCLCQIEAQVKYEKEYRLDRSKVPDIALDFVDQLRFDNKVKWYKEEGINKTSIEAKTKHRSKRYSVEFNSKGEIEDIEIKITQSEIPQTTAQNILEYLHANHQKIKICKIQLQLSGNSEWLIKSVVKQDFKDNPDITTRYEIVVRAKDNRKFRKLEYLFNHQGEMLSKAVIVLKNTDHLEY